MEEKLLSLQSWCKVNLLKIKKTKNEKFIKLDGKYYYIVLPNSKGKLINENCCFCFTDEERDELLEIEFDYFLFEFGKRWYYCPKKIIKDKQYEEEFFEANFNDFKYIGESQLEIVFDEFANLGIHSEYELLNGSHKADYWVKKAKFLKQKKIGICDKNTLAGVLAFQISCNKAEIDSVIGMTAVIRLGEIDYSIKLYVVDEIGWQNILHINKCINVDNEGFILENELLEHSKGLICVFTNESQINYSDLKQGKAIIKTFTDKFEDLYYQIDSVEYYSEKDDLEYLNSLKNYFENYSKLLKPVLINDCYYLDKEMFPVKEMLNKISKKSSIYSEDQYYKTLDENYDKLGVLFIDENKYNTLFKQMVLNACEISKKCSYKINTGQHKLPKYQFLKDGKSNEDLFYEIIEQGVENKLLPYYDNEKLEEYYARIKKECKVIVGAGFIDYFLILWDIVSWSKTNGILVGTGRGSVCGCLIAFLMDITTVDPVKFDLLFERFLNKTRVSGERAKAADSLPDVDLDFMSGERQRVKDYISERFGKLHTCSIGTFNRMKLKSAIKDYGREKGLDFQYINIITKDIDDEIEYTFQDFIKYALASKQLYEFFQKNPDIIHLAKHTLGQAKTASIHASALIIVPDFNTNSNYVDIYNWLPVRKIDGRLVSEWEGKSTDRAGFLKEDILGLSQLDKFKNIQTLIKRNYNKSLIIENIPLEDDDVFKLFKRGFNEDVFQFTSNGLKSYSKEVKPDDIEDLTAMTSLYRPGPMESNAHKDFALIKHGKKKPQFDYGLKEVTEKTLGLLIYQEQIMKAVVVLGGLTLVESDNFRTAIKKFDKKTMDSFMEKFVQGAINNKCDPEDAVRIWNKLLAFSGYGFNRSHALAYSLISYYSQWMKVNYPLEFWTSSLHFADDKLIPYRLSEIKKLKQGITVKPPSVNYSDASFECNVENQTIYWSLSKIKGLGDAKVNAVLDERKNGDFANYNDFIKRVPKNKVHKGIVTALILSGAFDEIEEINAPTQRIRLIDKHYLRLGEALPEEFKQKDKVNKNYFWILKQRELTGFGEINYVENLNSVNKNMAKIFLSYDNLQKSPEYTEACVCGIVAYTKEASSKRGTYLRLEIISNNEKIFITIWNDAYENNIDILKDCNGKMLAITGKVKDDSKYRGQNVLYSTDETKVIEL